MKQNFAKKLGCCVCKKCNTAVFATSFILFFSSGISWAFTTYEGSKSYSDSGMDASADMSDMKSNPSPAAADTCLPLLKTIRHTSQDVADRNQRSAGKAAVAGLVFGVRFALSPPKSPTRRRTDNQTHYQASFDVWSPRGDTLANDRSALAISAYRQCQKQKALKSLNGFRWAR